MVEAHTQLVGDLGAKRGTPRLRFVLWLLLGIIPTGVFSLIGLIGAGSLPAYIVGVGGSLFFLGLVATYAIDAVPQNRGGKEIAMTQTNKAGSAHRSRWVESIRMTIWAAGTSMWSALAQSG